MRMRAAAGLYGVAVHNAGKARVPELRADTLGGRQAHRLGTD